MEILASPLGSCGLYFCYPLRPFLSLFFCECVPTTDTVAFDSSQRGRILCVSLEGSTRTRPLQEAIGLLIPGDSKVSTDKFYTKGTPYSF